MLDISLFRDAESKDKIKQSEKKRFKDEGVVEKIFELDQERIKTNYQLDKINAEINTIQNKIKETFKSKEANCKEISQELNKLKIAPEAKRANLKERAIEIKTQIDKLIFSVGNIVDECVPVCKTDDGNVVVITHQGSRNLQNAPRGYADLMKGFTNPEAGTEVVGHRGYFLQGKMALLARALKNYAVDFLIQKEYEYIQTPVMMKKEVMGLTSQLSDFDDQLYKVEDNLYLIATSEQPISALYMNKKLTDEQLPISIAGESLCFRKEAGAYGKDNAGVFRVHQFDKIEQFVFCKPEDSPAIHEKMIKISEEFYQSLGLSYQVVLISSGELNDAASKKYDLEAWFPNAGKFRELVSGSNCTDYQSRNLNVGYGYPKENEKSKYVHMLNCTLCAVQRSLCCLVENYQEGDTIIVPKVLQTYTKFESFAI
ncbi:uncharacterized protein LOC143922100 [Arctopsyche grandis]|uniref:uncharacterized protein LOC143922100 n=1 Tax=Arctopsyche grandis TaxID=121162 RepID=UPI00406D88BE